MAAAPKEVCGRADREEALQAVGAAVGFLRVWTRAGIQERAEAWAGSPLAGSTDPLAERGQREPGHSFLRATPPADWVGDRSRGLEVQRYRGSSSPSPMTHLGLHGSI